MVSIASNREQATERHVASWLTTAEFEILESICETLFPSLEPPPGSSEDVAAYYRRSARDLCVAEAVAEKLGQQSCDVQHNIRRFLSLFTAPPASLVFTKSLSPFTSLPQAKREQYLLALANSPLGPLRQGFQGLKRLAGLIYFTRLDERGSNPNWSTLDYVPPSPLTPTALPPIVPMKITADRTLETDVVIVGSGAGGGVVAGELAKAGKRVIVLEQGGYNHEGNFRLREDHAFSELFLNKGALTTDNLGVVMMAGSTLGGGTVVNWMSSFRMDEDVLDEWDYSARLGGCFTGSDLQDSYAAVEQRLNVNSAHSQHNTQNQALFDGARTLGLHAGVIPRNAVGCAQRCGACTLGCRYGCNQSSMKTYLQDAYDHGAQIIVHGRADRVIIDHGRAVGVEASVRDADTQVVHNVMIRAKTVVLAAGALHSPALLMRSGLTNPQIGRHLRLHPSAISVGYYSEKVYAWQGVLQSAYSDQFVKLHGNYGYKLEVAPAHPGIFGLATPWYSARNYREEMADIAHLASIMILTRDKGEGVVCVDRSGAPVMKYRVSAYDRQHLLHGLRQGARIHAAAGAKRVISLQNKPTDVRLPSDTVLRDQLLRDFDHSVAHHGLGTNQIVLFSAHQMGTCRIGAHPARSVVDRNQQVHGTKGLFICDSSVFPSACGVNPMLTIMALSHRASRYIKEMA
jgi:choline dehydrogenase-like flavoprotein